MEHRIDGDLFAVGVLDFTSTSLSSVYFFYNPKYKFLGPGVLGALREIEYTQKVQELGFSKFEFYYMGYYFQDCQKSVYKANYKPSLLLCPHTYRFVTIDEEIKKQIEA